MKLTQTIGSVVLTLLVSATVATPPAQAVDHSHSLYGTVLDRHVKGGYFDYESFMRRADSRKKLDQYLDRMSRVEVSNLGVSEALAYWMNLYNAATIKLIETHYPVDSIRDIGGWFSDPWSMAFVETQRGTLTLDQIEHEIIRPEFDEPRIHFALVCAAKSCPPLRPEPYRENNLDEQLQEQARAFISSDKNQFSIEKDQVMMRLSMILSSDWYAVDFGGPSGVAEYVAPFLSDRTGALIRRDRYRIKHIEYNWPLNQTPGPYEGFTGASFGTS